MRRAREPGAAVLEPIGRCPGMSARAGCSASSANRVVPTGFGPFSICGPRRALPQMVPIGKCQQLDMATAPPRSMSLPHPRAEVFDGVSIGPPNGRRCRPDGDCCAAHRMRRIRTCRRALDDYAAGRHQRFRCDRTGPTRHRRRHRPGVQEPVGNGLSSCTRNWAVDGSDGELCLRVCGCATVVGRA